MQEEIEKVKNLQIHGRVETQYHFLYFYLSSAANICVCVSILLSKVGVPTVIFKNKYKL